MSETKETMGRGNIGTREGTVNMSHVGIVRKRRGSHDDPARVRQMTCVDESTGVMKSQSNRSDAVCYDIQKCDVGGTVGIDGEVSGMRRMSRMTSECDMRASGKMRKVMFGG
jgi:hypothetical protein